MDAVQLKFLRLHSHSSFQHITLSCTENQTSAAASDDSASQIIHLLGDSGKEIDSHFVTVSRKHSEVRLKDLWQFLGALPAAFYNCDCNTKQHIRFTLLYIREKEVESIIFRNHASHLCQIRVLLLWWKVMKENTSLQKINKSCVGTNKSNTVWSMRTF